MKIRIHHFFDIIRDFGSNKKIVAHPYQHSYHKIAELIRENADIEFEMVIAADKVCEGCNHLTSSGCDDIITHRSDFKGKEDFNNHLDKRIMEVYKINASKKYSPKHLCEIAYKYIENIEFIYEGNDLEHTQTRKENVLKGLKYYSEKHAIQIKWLSNKG